MTGGETAPPSGAAAVRVDDAWRGLAGVGHGGSSPPRTRHGDRCHRLGRQDDDQGPARGRPAHRPGACTPARCRSTTRPGVPLTLLGRAGGTPRPSSSRWAPASAGNIAALCDDRRAPRRCDHEHRAGPRRPARGAGRASPGRRASCSRRSRPTGSRCSMPPTTFTPELRARTRAQVLLVGRAGDDRADVEAADVQVDDELRARFELRTPWGTVPVRLELRGEHQVTNAAHGGGRRRGPGRARRRCGRGAVPGLRRHRGAWSSVRTPAGVVVLNDAYNASPTSTAAALRAPRPARGPGPARRGAGRDARARRPSADEQHALVGRLAAELGIDVVVAVGDAAGAVARGAREAGATGAIEVHRGRRRRRRDASRSSTACRLRRRGAREGEPAGRARAGRRGAHGRGAVDA